MSGQLPKPEELRIVLVGLTGGGKTWSMNTLLGRSAVTEASPSSQETRCTKETVTHKGQPLVIIDTPGLMNTEKSKDELRKDIVEMFGSVAPGPHVFLFVAKQNFSEEDDEALRVIREIFGDDSQKYTMALFTRADEYEVTADDLKDLFIGEHINGFHCFNNTVKKEEQVTELVEKIRVMVKGNKGEHYSSAMLEQAQEMMQKELEKAKSADQPAHRATAMLGFCRSVLDATGVGEIGDIMEKIVECVYSIMKKKKYVESSAIR